MVIDTSIGAVRNFNASLMGDSQSVAHDRAHFESLLPDRRDKKFRLFSSNSFDRVTGNQSRYQIRASSHK